MTEINTEKKISELQGIIDRITADGCWLYVYTPDRKNMESPITFLPHALKVLKARPMLDAGGNVINWRYALLMIDRGFTEPLASMHDQHLFIIERIEWVRGGKLIYSGYFYAVEPEGVKFYLIGIHAGEYPEEAEQWRDYLEALKKIPDKAQRTIDNIIEEFSEMAERMIDG